MFFFPPHNYAKKPSCFYTAVYSSTGKDYIILDGCASFSASFCYFKTLRYSIIAKVRASRIAYCWSVVLINYYTTSPRAPTSHLNVFEFALVVFDSLQGNLFLFHSLFYFETFLPNLCSFFICFWHFCVSFYLIFRLYCDFTSLCRNMFLVS